MNIFTQSLSYCLLAVVLSSIESSTTTNTHRQKRSIENLGAFCSNDTSHGNPNMNPIDDSPPRFVSQVENGTLYMIGGGEDQSWLVHVWGNNGYDYGFAYGTLLREQIQILIPRAWIHFEQQVLDDLSKLKLPEWFKKIIADKGLAFALDLQNSVARPYMDDEIYEEMRGIANAAEVDFDTIRRIHMLVELTRGEK
jgi:hypothetical protein